MRIPIGAVACFIVALLALAGCFKTKLKLTTPEQAKVDPAYVGDWRFDEKDGDKTATVIVRNFNGHEYYAEWGQKDEKIARMNGIIADVKGATFAQLTDLTDDGALEEKHVIVRVQLKDGKLSLRHLEEDFFRSVTTDEQLKSKLAENLDNAAMYEGEEMLGTKVEPQAAK